MTPWIVVSIILTSATFIVFLMSVASPSSLSVVKCFAIVIYFVFAVYFIISVYSYRQIIRIQMKNARNFLDNDFLSEGTTLTFLPNKFLPHFAFFRLSQPGGAEEPAQSETFQGENCSNDGRGGC